MSSSFWDVFQANNVQLKEASSEIGRKPYYFLVAPTKDRKSWEVAFSEFQELSLGAQVLADGFATKEEAEAWANEHKGPNEEVVIRDTDLFKDAAAVGQKMRRFGSGSSSLSEAKVIQFGDMVKVKEDPREGVVTMVAADGQIQVTYQNAEIVLVQPSEVTVKDKTGGTPAEKEPKPLEVEKEPKHEVMGTDGCAASANEAHEYKNEIDVRAKKDMWLNDPRVHVKKGQTFVAVPSSGEGNRKYIYVKVRPSGPSNLAPLEDFEVVEGSVSERTSRNLGQNGFDLEGMFGNLTDAEDVKPYESRSQMGHAMDGVSAILEGSTTEFQPSPNASVPPKKDMPLDAGSLESDPGNVGAVAASSSEVKAAGSTAFEKQLAESVRVPFEIVAWDTSKLVKGVVPMHYAKTFRDKYKLDSYQARFGDNWKWNKADDTLMGEIIFPDKYKAIKFYDDNQMMHVSALPIEKEAVEAVRFTWGALEAEANKGMPEVSQYNLDAPTSGPGSKAGVTVGGAATGKGSTRESFESEHGISGGSGSSAKPAPVQAFTHESSKEAAAKINAGVKASFVGAYTSSLGGPEHITVMVRVTLEPEDKWPHGIWQNAHYMLFSFEQNGTLEMFNKSHEIGAKFRKTRVKSVDDAINKINQFVQLAGETSVSEARELSVPDRHQLRVLKQTLRMPDAMVGVMGGPSKEESREILKTKFGYSDAQIAKLEESASSAMGLPHSETNTTNEEDTPMPAPFEETEDEEEIQEPDEDDAFIQSNGFKLTVSVEGKVLGEVVEEEEAEKLLKDWMEKNKYWPSVWYVSDHGNVSPYSMTEALTAAGRKRIAPSNFALQRQKKYPIHDISHARNALSRVSQFGTEAEKATVRRKVHQKYPSLSSTSEKVQVEYTVTEGELCDKCVNTLVAFVEKKGISAEAVKEGVQAALQVPYAWVELPEGAAIRFDSNAGILELRGVFEDYGSPIGTEGEGGDQTRPAATPASPSGTSAGGPDSAGTEEWQNYQRNEQGIITSPGKFEGEMYYVPYFWDMANQGFADLDGGAVVAFKLGEEDWAKFPELKGMTVVTLEEEGNGFVRAKAENVPWEEIEDDFNQHMMSQEDMEEAYIREVQGYALHNSDKLVIKAFLKGKDNNDYYPSDGKNLYLENGGKTIASAWEKNLASWVGDNKIKLGQASGNVSQTWVNAIKKMARAEGIVVETVVKEGKGLPTVFFIYGGGRYEAEGIKDDKTLRAMGLPTKFDEDQFEDVGKKLRMHGFDVSYKDTDLYGNEARVARVDHLVDERIPADDFQDGWMASEAGSEPDANKMNNPMFMMGFNSQKTGELGGVPGRKSSRFIGQSDRTRRGRAEASDKGSYEPDKAYAEKKAARESITEGVAQLAAALEKEFPVLASENNNEMLTVQLTKDLHDPAESKLMNQIAARIKSEMKVAKVEWSGQSIHPNDRWDDSVAKNVEYTFTWKVGPREGRLPKDQTNDQLEDKMAAMLEASLEPGTVVKVRDNRSNQEIHPELVGKTGKVLQAHHERWGLYLDVQLEGEESPSHFDWRDVEVVESMLPVPEGYGDKRDKKKIEIFVKDKDGKFQYKATTTWADTCKQAKDEYLKKHTSLDASDVKCSLKEGRGRGVWILSGPYKGRSGVVVGSEAEGSQSGVVRVVLDYDDEVANVKKADIKYTPEDDPETNESVAEAKAGTVELIGLVRDGYLIGAETDPSAQEFSYWEMAQEVEPGDEIFSATIPAAEAEKFIAHGTSGQVYGDGYEAFDALKAMTKDYEVINTYEGETTTMENFFAVADRLLKINEHKPVKEDRGRAVRIISGPYKGATGVTVPMESPRNQPGDIVVHLDDECARRFKVRVVGVDKGEVMHSSGGSSVSEKKEKKSGPKQVCPKCGKEVWDVAGPDQDLNKCWSCGQRWMNDPDDAPSSEVNERYSLHVERSGGKWVAHLSTPDEDRAYEFNEKSEVESFAKKNDLKIVWM